MSPAAVWARLVALSAVLAALPARAGDEVTIERATIPWKELERLISRGEGRPAAERRAPNACSLTMAVDGEVSADRVRLSLVIEATVLDERWVVVPLLPAQMAVASATVSDPPGGRGLLARGPEGVAFVAQGAGAYRLEIEAEGGLELGRWGARLALAPGSLAGGRASLVIPVGQRPGGRTPWRLQPLAGGRVVAQAALGAGGLELILASSELTPAEPGLTIEGLRAVTVLSLGGAGVTRLTMDASAGKAGQLVVALPRGARMWKAFSGSTPLAHQVESDGAVRLTLKGPARVELAYTFDTPPMGIRGRYRVELPRMPVPIRDARWELWLPSGIAYKETQAALSVCACEPHEGPARTPLSPQGRCFGFERAVLGPGAAFIEGAYEQPL